MEGWTAVRRFVASTLHAKLAEEFGAVRSASLKLSGRNVRERSRRVDAIRDRVLVVVHAPHAGLTADECKALKDAVEDLQVAAERATGRKRRFQWTLLTTFVVGVAVGFLVDVIVRVLDQ